MNLKTELTSLICTLFVVSSIFGQQTFSSSNPDYIKLVTAGEKALNETKFDSCLIYYKQAFEIKQTSFLSTMRAAACAFMNDDQKKLKLHLDSAFSINWGGAKQVFDNNPEFEIVRGTDFEKRVQNYYENAAAEAGVNLELMMEMETMQISDQEQRQHMREFDKKYGWQSPQMDSLWSLQNYSDSVNTVRISEIIDKMGYPGKSVVGPRLASTAFLIIQHASQEVQEKYLDVITGAADAGEVPWRSVALLVDRVRLGQDKKQIYGSQVGTDRETNESYFFPIEQPHKVDSLRASVGLGLLQEYAEHFEFDWDIEKHIKRHSN